MSDIDTLKAEIKKLSARATNAKMDLHDLSEELPLNWQTIMSMAEKTYNAFKTLDEARTRLKAMEAAAKA
jgi:hypothetical protein